MWIIIASLFAFLLGVALTVIARIFAPGFGLVAIPRDDRWHEKRTPLLGGAAIYITFVVGFFLFVPDLSIAYPILASGTLLFVAGLVDDAVQIKPYTKLVIQLIASAVIVYFGVRLPWVEYKWINDVLTIFWLVGITNAINLLDNMDGLAGGVSVIACVFLVITFLLNGQVALAMLPALLGGAALGFLVFNFNPASIFMGDSGSMFLGFMLSGTALLSEVGRFRNLTSVLLTPVLILMIPIFDTCLVTVTRKLSGRPISQGGRDHTSHRLVALGIPERRAVLLLYMFAAVSGTIALLVKLTGTAIVLALVPGFALAVLLLGLYLGKVVIHEEGRLEPGMRILSTIADSSYKRRIFEVLLDAVLVVLAYYGAYLLRWDGSLPDDQLAIFLKTLPLVLMIEIFSFLAGGVYRGLWRYIGVDDLLTIIKSVLFGSAASAFVVLLVHSFVGPSRAVLLLNFILLAIFVSGSRFSFRLLRTLIRDQAKHHPDARPVLIYGAGDGGELLIREIINNPQHLYAPVGFIDDDETKAGKLIHGYRIFGFKDLPDLIRAHGVSEVIVSSLKVSDGRLDTLKGLGVGFKKMSIRIE